MTKRVRLSDVAAHADVSLGTVSNVLNKPERVSARTRERVFSSMRDLGYVGPLITVPARRSIQMPVDMNAPLLVSVGYVSVDTVGMVDVMPQRTDRITARQVSKHIGGPAAGVAVAASALGSPFEVDAELASVVGDDDDSHWAMDLLARRGVRVRAVRRPQWGRLSRCIVIVEASGHRTRINEHLEIDGAELSPHLSKEPGRRRRHLHFEGYQVIGILPLLPDLRLAGWTASLHDTGLPESHISAAGFTELSRVVDIFVINRRTASAVLGMGDYSTSGLVEEFGRFWRSLKGQCEVVVTLGVEGAAVFAPGTSSGVIVPALPVDIVDGTGAGDAFTGAYLAQRLHDEVPCRAARRACIAASLNMTVEGAQGRLTSTSEIGELDDAERS